MMRTLIALTLDFIFFRLFSPSYYLVDRRAQKIDEDFYRASFLGETLGSKKKSFRLRLPSLGVMVGLFFFMNLEHFIEVHLYQDVFEDFG